MLRRLFLALFIFVLLLMLWDMFASLPAPAASPVAAHVVRLSQFDRAQYASDQQYATWRYSACSATSMTVALDVLGGHYRIADVLAVEIRLGEITPQLGLLEEQGIARTVQAFGFQADLSHARTLAQVIALAHHGVPVIVSFPPSRWRGGHLLVVTDGDDSTVSLADSSTYNLHVLSYAKFLAWWGGFSAAISLEGGLS